MTTSSALLPAGFPGLDESVAETVRDELGVDMTIDAESRTDGRSLVIAGVGTIARSMIIGSGFNALMADAGVDYTTGRDSDTPADLLGDATWDIGLCFSPWKEHLFDILDHTSVSARDTRAVDTLARLDGDVVGMNLNGYAASYALRAAARGVAPARVVVLGSGPSSRSVAWGARHAWGDSLEIIISARSEESGRKCASMFGARFTGPHDLAAIADTIVVNSTSWGETPQSEEEAFAFDLSTFLASGDVLFDLNTRVSSLASVALGRGATVASGSTMRAYNNACRAAIAQALASEGKKRS